MSNNEVPLSIVSAPGSNFLSAVVIGNQQYYPPTVADNSFWFSVYDRSSLKQVFSQLQVGDADSVPGPLSGQFNTPQYFLVVATRTLYSAYVPAGALHAFLVDNGANVALKTLTQVYQQVGCGSLGIVTYAMAGVLGPGATGHPSVEASAIAANASQFLEATLVGAVVNNQTLYTPFPLTPPTP
jgi:hypothetical protein